MLGTNHTDAMFQECHVAALLKSSNFEGKGTGIIVDSCAFSFSLLFFTTDPSPI